MVNILNIDTSSSQCSVALSQGPETVFGLESSQKMDHSSSLAPFIKQGLNFLKERGEKLEAVSVSNGPGSYTGLRIGLSMAKGLAYGLNIPLITLSTLEIMATRALFSYHEVEGDECIVPMMDARRMEVYTAVFDSALHPMLAPCAMILDESSFENLYNKRKVLFIGDGTLKFKELYKGNNAIWLGEGMAHAKFMPVLSYKFYNEKKFADVAYAVPFYLKEYQTTQSKSKGLN